MYSYGVCLEKVAIKCNQSRKSYGPLAVQSSSLWHYPLAFVTHFFLSLETRNPIYFSLPSQLLTTYPNSKSSLFLRLTAKENVSSLLCPHSTQQVARPHCKGTGRNNIVVAMGISQQRRSLWASCKIA